MASLKPITTGTSNRLESLYASLKGKVSGKTSPNKREASPGTFNDASLSYSKTVLGIDTSKRYK